MASARFVIIVLVLFISLSVAATLPSSLASEEKTMEAPRR